MSFLQSLFGTKQLRDLRELTPYINRINEEELKVLSMDQNEFLAQTNTIRKKISQGEHTNGFIPLAFALAREAARRILGERLYDVQLYGSIALYQGRITEMKTGEGKTLAAVPAAYLRSLEGKGVHIVTVNDYLAKRDAEWMQFVFEYLGVSVGVIQSNMAPQERRNAYNKDITYATNNELGFDYLRDNMSYAASQKVQRGHFYSIIDEIDSILIDESRTPLIISGSQKTNTEKYYNAHSIIHSLRECEKDPHTGTYPEEPQGDYTLDEKGKRVQFTTEGFNSIEALLKKRKYIDGALVDAENFDYLHFVTQAVRAQELYQLDREYVVRDGKVEIVDEFTGRILHGRRYSDGLHQAIEVKEKIKAANQSVTIASITLQNYFRMYRTLSGMTGTASTESTEFTKIYGLDVVEIPTNRPVNRNDQQDLIFPTSKSKFIAICEEIKTVHEIGQPILIGTVSVEMSEVISKLLQGYGIRHEVLNAKNHAREAQIISEAGAKGAVTIATNMAGRGTDIKLGGNPEFRTRTKIGPDGDLETYERVYKKEYEQWRAQYDEVKNLGGLFVLGTERHESRRIDNQLRGRSGRQGDPGRSQFFVSLDDNLMRLFGGSIQTLKNYLSKGLEPGEAIHHSMITKSLERAQKRVEERNFDIRKHLLEFDDVLNTQRDRIYAQRNQILYSENLQTRIFEVCHEEISQLFSTYMQDGDAIEFNTAVHTLKQRFFFATTIKQGSDRKQTVQAITAELEASLNEKMTLVGKERWNDYIRHTYLSLIDRNWREHLSALEALREAVYLRSYAQKNPLLEYKLEGFDAYDAMVERIRVTIVKQMIATRVTNRSTESKEQQVYKTQHQSLTSFNSQKRSSSTQTQQMTVRRSTPKVGRNDPCPCGSGKKYKQCHGKSE